MDENKNGAAARPQAMEVGDDGLYIMRTQQDVLRVARHLLQTGAVPKSLANEEQVAMAVQSLKSLGLNPYASIRQCGFVNGAFVIHTDLPLAVVRASGKMVGFEEFVFTMGDDGQYKKVCFANSNCHLEPFGAVCRVRRVGGDDLEPTHEVVFTAAQAKTAGLWGKGGPWRQYPGRMLTFRARSQALKDIFSDVLAGVSIQEYDADGADAPAGPPGGRRAARQVDIEDADAAPAPPVAVAQQEAPAEAAPPAASRVAALTARLRAGAG